MKIPVLSDFRKEISKNYGVLLDNVGAALRYSKLNIFVRDKLVESFKYSKAL